MTDIQNHHQQDYRQNAVDCVRQAQGEDTSDGRDILLNVALAWLRLANQTEQTESADRSDDDAAADPSPVLAS